jgi:hypothetical protein
MANNPVPLRRLKSYGLLCLAGLALHSPARAAVLWEATFESGDLSEWTAGINNPGNVEVLGEQVFAGLYAGKITVHPEDLFGEFVQNRVDIQHPSTLTGEGSQSWLSGHYMIPVDAQVRNQIGFYESNVSFQNVMDFWIEPKQGGGTTISFGVGFLGATVLWTGDFTAGVWHQVAIHVLWSESAATGRVDVWFDGVQVVTDEPAETKADGNTLFYQTGLHRIVEAPFTETIYLDNFIEADTFADAQIMAPPTAGGSGGTGGAAGTGGGGSGGATTGGGGAGGNLAGGSGSSGAAGAGGVAGGAGTAGSSGSAPVAAAGTSASVPSAAPQAGGCACSLRPADRWMSAAFSLLALVGLRKLRRRRKS